MFLPDKIKSNQFFLTLLILCSFYSNFAFCLGVHATGISNPSDIEELDTEDDDSEKIESNIPDQTEVRDHFKYAGTLAGGQFFPWQLYSIELIYQQTYRRGFSFFAGGGHFSKKSNEPLSNNYDVEANTYSFGMTHRLFLTEIMPIALVSAFSFGSMSGSLSPRSSNVDETNRSGSDFLSSSFRCNMISLATGLSLSYAWINGMLIEWNVIAAHKSWALRPKIDRNEEERLGEVRKFTDQAKLYGVINLKVGYYFK